MFHYYEKNIYLFVLGQYCISKVSSKAGCTEGGKKSVYDHPIIGQSSDPANSKSANSCAHIPVSSQDVKPMVLMGDYCRKEKSYSRMHQERMRKKKLMVYLLFGLAVLTL